MNDAIGFAVYTVILLALGFLFAGDPDLWDMLLKNAKTGACK